MLGLCFHEAELSKQKLRAKGGQQAKGNEVERQVSLQLQASAHGLKFTRNVIKQAFGASVEELFEEFEEVPVASGSIGQVYQAKLSPKGARNTGVDPGTYSI